MTAALTAFLVAHGLVHLAIWLPKPDSGNPPPFAPDHSVVLAAARVPQRATTTLAVALAAAAAGALSLGGVGLAMSSAWTPQVAVAGACTGLLLKVVYFNRWLSLGILLDLGVLSAATTEWPLALT